MTVDTTIIEQVVGTTVSVALRNIVMGIGGIVYLFTLSPKLTGVHAARHPVDRRADRPARPPRARTSRATSQDRIADVGAITAEDLGAMKIVQAFGQEEPRGRALHRRGRKRCSPPPSAASCCAR